jgi:hypothetical protein
MPESAPATDHAGRHALAWAGLALGAGAATWIWAFIHHTLLLYGDATAHLAIARRMVDSATPGLSQWGTVWLPLPHLLMAPFVLVTAWWQSGLAGSLPSLAALVVATWLLHRIVARQWGAVAAGWAAAFFCLNPSLLYLSVVPMTESIYLAAFLGVVERCGAYADEPRPATAWQIGAWGLAASLCRYDGWFLLPFALWVVARYAADAQRAMAAGLRFCLVAGIGPVFWLIYNWWYFDDPLAFVRGPYSARQIALRGGTYPGDHNLWLAALYFLKAVTLTCGVPLMLLATAGWLVWRGRGAGWLLLVPLPWYLWAMWSGNVPIFIPQYWPHGYYNLRYGVQLLPAVAAGSAMVAAALWRAARRVILPRLSPRAAGAGVIAGLALVCAAAYGSMLRAPGPPAYAEAAHNAPGRLAMEHALAGALASWRPGQRILMYYGSYPGALADDAIPVSAVVQESNFLLWQDALYAPHRHADWVVVEQRTLVAKWIGRRDLEQYFHPVASLRVDDQPTIEVYRRNGK